MDKSLWVSIIGAVMSVLYSFITSEWQAGGRLALRAAS